MADNEESRIFGVAGYIVIFSFISIVFIFMSMLIVGALNNYGLNELIEITDSFVLGGIVPSDYGTLARQTGETYTQIIPYLDLIWFGGFLSLVISSLIFSYLRARENYFNILTFSVLGIIIFMYVGGVMVGITSWFNSEILTKVFPSISSSFPLFSWYLDNIGVINLILIVANVIVNYVDLDLNRFTRRKDGDSFEEV